MQQLHLNAKRCSGRGVRIRQLSPAQLDSIVLNAAKLLDPGATMLELRQASMRDGINAMIVEYTEEEHLADLGSANWKKASLEFLNDNYSKLFTSKDDKILSAVYREYHEAEESEIRDIMGKALDVAV